MNKASYWAQDVCKMLNLSDSTLRRWCITMKKKGYVFETDDNGRRRFFERDINAIRTIQQLSERQDTTIEQAIDQIITGTNMDSIAGYVMNDERAIDTVRTSKEIIQSIIDLDSRTEKGLLAIAQEIDDLKGTVKKQNELIERLIADQTAASQESKEKKGWLSKLFGK